MALGALPYRYRIIDKRESKGLVGGDKVDTLLGFALTIEILDANGTAIKQTATIHVGERAFPQDVHEMAVFVVRRLMLDDAGSLEQYLDDLIKSGAEFTV